VFVTAISGEGGPIELPHAPPPRPVMKPEVAYLMTSLLESVVQEGTGQRALSLGRPVAGKTGTTNKAKDAWFVGYSVDLVVAVWVGYDDAVPLGGAESGASAALPIWLEFMKAAHEGKPKVSFPRPTGIVEAKIDPTSGLLARYEQEDAKTEIFLAGTAPTETAAEVPVEAAPSETDGETSEPEEDGDLETPPGAGSDPGAPAAPEAPPETLDAKGPLPGGEPTEDPAEPGPSPQPPPF
jgi:penicillin-binding protein 1A